MVACIGVGAPDGPGVIYVSKFASFFKFKAFFYMFILNYSGDHFPLYFCEVFYIRRLILLEMNPVNVVLVRVGRRAGDIER